MDGLYLLIGRNYKSGKTLFCVTINKSNALERNDFTMEELKQMLEAIHEENKDILTLLCFYDDVEEQTDENFKEISKEINDRYDELFYGKETDETTN